MGVIAVAGESGIILMVLLSLAWGVGDAVLKIAVDEIKSLVFSLPASWWPTCREGVVGSWELAPMPACFRTF